MPAWILLSLLYPTLFGVVATIDKIILDRYVTTVYLYCFWIGVYELVLGAVFVAIAGGIEEIDTTGAWGGFLTGVIQSFSILLLLAAVKRGQVARVLPIWYMYPLMVAPMAAGFLNETLPALAWVSVPLAVMGGILVTWQGGGDIRRFGDPLTMLLALSAALCFGVSIILTKQWVEEETFWQFYAFGKLGHAAGMLGITLMVADVRRMALGSARNRGFMGYIALNQGLVTGASMVNLGAVILGPVTLVSAIGSLQPASVFLYSLILATLFPASFRTWITWRTLRPQTAGILAITGAVALITISERWID